MIRIKELRTEMHKSLRDVANDLNISYSSLSKYERGDQQPSYETLIRIANYFNVTTDYLMGITNSKSLENRNICDQLNLSDEAIQKLKQLPLVVDKYNGISLSDILNFIIIQPEFKHLLKSILLYKIRTPADWCNMENYLNKDNTTPVSQHQIKEIDKLYIIQQFNNILSHVLEDEITTYNTIAKTQNGITISNHKEVSSD